MAVRGCEYGTDSGTLGLPAAELCALGMGWSWQIGEDTLVGGWDSAQ